MNILLIKYAMMKITISGLYESSLTIELKMKYVNIVVNEAMKSLATRKRHPVSLSIRPILVALFSFKM